ncbi:MAG: M13 family metallopeptidase [Terriglobales bacterium]
MRSLLVIITAAVLSTCAIAQSQQVGVYAGDINRSADPCNDFYDYANGAWRAQNPIPASMDRWSRRWQAGEQNKEQLKTILDDLSQKHDWPKSSVEQLVSDHYGSCMDAAKINAAGIGAIEPMLKQIEAMKNMADVQRMIARLHDIAIFVPFGLYAAPDNHDPANVIAYVYASGLGLPDRDYYVKPDERFKDAREKYRQHVAKMFALAGAAETQAKAASDTVFAIETQLAQASLDNVALRDPQATDHKTQFADLRKMTPSFDWTGYFKQTRVPQAALNVNEPKFMAELEHQLTGTSLADWKIYLKWHLLNTAAPWLSQPFVDEDFAFKGKYLQGRQEIKPRWKRCVENTDELLGEALGRKYVERYFPPVAKARATEMVQNILAAMKDTITGLDWMSPQTRQKALDKLAKFNVKVGYPDKWKDYSKVKISRASFWANYMEGAKFNVEDDHSQIGKPVDRARWGMTPPTSDAYNNFQMNEIVFPAGILQPPAFNAKAVDAVNYGAIGVVIGHEVSHGFDDQGAQYDANGKLQNWWTPEDLKRFQARGQCVVNQFENYFIEPGIHHNGKLVLGESIGDLGGVKVAYLAFQKAQQQHPAPTMDGFTPDQQFFLAWGQFRGDETRPETQRLMVQGDPHPVAKYRVIGPLSNFAPFQQAFHCKEGSAMVRPAAQRCEVW